MCDEWETVLAQFRERAPEAVQAVEALARSNMTRYFACLGNEARGYGEGLRLLRRAFRASPAAFLSDRRNWIAGAACLAGLLLPARFHQRLERLAGLHR